MKWPIEECRDRDGFALHMHYELKAKIHSVTFPIYWTKQSAIFVSYLEPLNSFLVRVLFSQKWYPYMYDTVLYFLVYYLVQLNL